MEGGDRQNDVTVLGKLCVGVCIGYSRHRQRSKARFSEQSNENLDTVMLIEVLRTRRTKRRATTTHDVASKPSNLFRSTYYLVSE